jgi:hypothetical protein
MRTLNFKLKQPSAFAFVSVLLAFFAALTQNSFAAADVNSKVLCLTSAIRALEQKLLELPVADLSTPEFDSTIEMEFSRTPELLQLLTTDNGTLAPLLKYTKSIPKEIRTWMKAHPEYGKDPNQIDWEVLPYAEKVVLLKAVSATRDYSVDRTVPGIRVKTELPFHFTEKTEFMGKTYVGRTQMIDASGFELHFRAKQSAGKMFEDSKTLCDGLKLPFPGAHLHMVRKIPVDLFKEEPEIQTLLLMELFRRANMVANLQLISLRAELKKTVSISNPRKVQVNYLRQEQLQTLAETVLKTIPNDQPFLLRRHNLRMSEIGLRDSSTYDVPGLLGFEVRTLARMLDTKSTGKFLDALQAKFLAEDFGVDRKSLLSWLKLQRKKSSRTLPAIIGKSWYNGELSSSDLSSLPSSIRKAIDGPENWKRFMDLSDSNSAMKILVHDWSNDPLFYGKKSAAKNISSLQALSIKKILNGAPPLNELRDFAEASGLNELFAKSMGG